MVFAQATKKRKIISPSRIAPILAQFKEKLLSRRGRFTRKQIIIGGIMVIVCLTVFSIFSSDLLTVKNPKCFLDDQACPLVLQIEVKKLENERILTLNIQEFERHILFNQPAVQSLKILKRLPNYAEVRFTSRKPIAVITDSSGHPYQVDKDNKVFAEGDISELIHIKTQESVAVGEPLTSLNLQAALRLRQVLEESYIPVLYITVSDQHDMEVELQSTIKIAFTGEKDMTKQVDALQFILNNSKMEENKIKSIDLRFDNPIVKN